jgi:hypothetical protein
MDMSARMEGLDEAMEAMQAAFPSDHDEQRKIVTGTIRRSAAKTILAEAKQRALAGDGSGALSESLGIRNLSRRRVQAARIAGGVEIAPIRRNLKAIALYIAYYYTALGRTPKTDIIESGIRHGHLVEFGTARSAASPFLWPAAKSGLSPYMQRMAEEMRQEIRRRVARKSRSPHRSGRR